MVSQYCAKCGNLVGGQSRFCSECGNNLMAPGSVTNAPLASTPAQPAAPSTLKRLSAPAIPAASSASTLKRLSSSAQATPESAAAPSPFAANHPYAAYNPAPPPAGYYRGEAASAPPPPPGYYVGDPGSNAPPPGYYIGDIANPASAGYYGLAGEPAPRRNWGLMVMVIAPVVLIGILLLFYTIFIGSSISKFGSVADAINGNNGSSIIPASCTYQDEGGGGLRGELSAAIATMCNTDSFHIVMDGKMNGLAISLSGDFKRGVGEFTARGAGVTYIARVVGGAAYLSYDSGKTWTRDSTGQVQNVAVFAALFDLIPSNFSDTPEDQGSEQLPGETAHKIGITGGGPGTLMGAGSNGTATFWVVDNNGKKAVRQLQIDGKLEGTQASIYLEYTNFNEPVNVSVPSVASPGNSGGYGYPGGYGNGGYGNGGGFLPVTPALHP